MALRLVSYRLLSNDVYKSIELITNEYRIIYEAYFPKRIFRIILLKIKK